jgi:multisubunit Na+/H+ antiporter MnhC subunit
MSGRHAGHWLDILAVLLSVGAGVYLLLSRSPAGINSWFSVIAHGMGAYFLAKGVYMGRALHLQARIVDLLAGDEEPARQAPALRAREKAPPV